MGIQKNVQIGIPTYPFPVTSGMFSNIQTFIKTTFLSKLKNLFIPLINKIKFDNNESKNLKIQKKLSNEVGQKLQKLLGDEKIDSFEVYLNSFKNLEISIKDEILLMKRIHLKLFQIYLKSSKLHPNWMTITSRITFI